MERIDRNKLYTDSAYRFEYVAKFMDFGEADIKTIEKIADKIRPLVPVVVDAVYDKLFKFDITKKHFMPKNEGYEGEVPTDIEQFSVDHPQIKFRKHFLTKYLNKLLSGPYDERMLRYLDWVAKIHTDTPEKKSKINVEYLHINALMGYVETTLVGGILSLDLDKETEVATLAAFNKLLWIQNDYFAKYYCNPEKPVEATTITNVGATQTTLIPALLGLVIGASAVWFGVKNHGL